LILVFQIWHSSQILRITSEDFKFATLK